VEEVVLLTSDSRVNAEEIARAAGISLQEARTSW
jgi:cation transport ATPase